MIFDIMYLDGKSLMNEPFSNRRQALERIFSLSNLSNHSLSLAPQLVSNNPLRIRDFLKKQIDSSLEGIVTKRLDSPYSPTGPDFHGSNLNGKVRPSPADWLILLTVWLWESMPGRGKGPVLEQGRS